MNKSIKNVLITGGAGYIGCNVTQLLAQKKFNVIIVDNFSNSYPHQITTLTNYYKNIKLYDADLLDDNDLDQIFSENKIDAVIHLAGKKYVSESFEKIDLYNLNNITATHNLLKAMSKHNIKKIVFASSITVYGASGKKFTENLRLKPLSPYAKNKVDGEKLIKTWAKNNKSNYVILRLSNPVGANPKFNLGDEAKTKYENLLPYVSRSIFNKIEMNINGNTHNTEDGTTERDYLSVIDISKAFLKALSFNSNEIFNIGSGKTCSVLDIIKTTEKCLKIKAIYTFAEKRKGDAAILFTDCTKAKKLLKFQAKNNLKTIVKNQCAFMINKKKL